MQLNPIFTRAMLLVLAFLSFSSFGIACKYDSLIRVDETGDGEVVAIIAIDDLIMNFARMGGDDVMSALLDEASDGVVESDDDGNGMRIESYQDDGYEGWKITVPFDADDLFSGDRTIGDLLLAGMGDLIGLGDYMFERNAEDDGWVFLVDQAIDFDIMDAMEESLGEMMDGSGFPSFGLPDPEITFRLDLPGTITEHNADRLVDGVLVWDVDLSDDVYFSAKSQDASSGIGIASIIVAGVFAFILLCIAIGVPLSRSRSRKRAESRLAASGKASVSADSSVD